MQPFLKTLLQENLAVWKLAITLPGINCKWMAPPDWYSEHRHPFGAHVCGSGPWVSGTRFQRPRLVSSVCCERCVLADQPISPAANRAAWAAWAFRSLGLHRSQISLLFSECVKGPVRALSDFLSKESPHEPAISPRVGTSRVRFE